MGQLGSRESAGAIVYTLTEPLGLGLSLFFFFLAIRFSPAHHLTDLTLLNSRKLDPQIQFPRVGTPFILLKLPSA